MKFHPASLELFTIAAGKGYARASFFCQDADGPKPQRPRLITIRSAECTGCLECVAVCPAAGALFLSAPRAKRVPAWVVAAGIAVLFLGVCGYAAHWHTNLTGNTYFELIPHAKELTHP